MTERWDNIGADALYALLGYPGRKPDWHSGDAEHVQAHAVVTAVLADLRRQILDMPSHVWVNGTESYRSVKINQLLDLLYTGGSDE